MRYATVLREPVERIVSQYYYWLGRKKKSQVKSGHLSSSGAALLTIDEWWNMQKKKKVGARKANRPWLAVRKIWDDTLLAFAQSYNRRPSAMHLCPRLLSRLRLCKFILPTRLIIRL